MPESPFHLLTPPRLPVWPVQAGLVALAARGLGARRWSERWEERQGGLVTPIPLDEASSPFLMLVHHRHRFDRWDPVRPLFRWVMPEGFPAHPHLGFDTLTLILEGALRHRDSLGERALTRRGTLQWLSAGRGLHHEELWAPDEGGPLQEVYQIWVDVPRAQKEAAPRLRLSGAGSDDPFPVWREGPVQITLWAGQWDERRALCGATPLQIAQVRWVEAGPWPGPVSEQLSTRLAFVRHGPLHEGGRSLARGQLLHAVGGGASAWQGEPGAELLWVAGQPLHQPVLRQGPVVAADPEQLRRLLTGMARGQAGRAWSHHLDEAGWRAHVAAPR